MWGWREGKIFPTLLFSFSQVQVETLKEPNRTQRIKRLWFQISKELSNNSDYSRLHDFRIFVKGSDDVSVVPLLPTQINSVFSECCKSTFTLEQLMFHQFLGAVCYFNKIKLFNKVKPWRVYLPSAVLTIYSTLRIYIGSTVTDDASLNECVTITTLLRKRNRSQI